MNEDVIFSRFPIHDKILLTWFFLARDDTAVVSWQQVVRPRDRYHFLFQIDILVLIGYRPKRGERDTEIHSPQVSSSSRSSSMAQ